MTWGTASRRHRRVGGQGTCVSFAARAAIVRGGDASRANRDRVRDLQRASSKGKDFRPRKRGFDDDGPMSYNSKPRGRFGGAPDAGFGGPPIRRSRRRDRCLPARGASGRGSMVRATRLGFVGELPVARAMGSCARTICAARGDKLVEQRTEGRGWRGGREGAGGEWVVALRRRQQWAWSSSHRLVGPDGRPWQSTTQCSRWSTEG